MEDLNEEEALKRIMEMRSSLFSFLVMLLPPEADVEAVFQEVVLGVWKAVKAGGVENFEAYVYGVAKNQAKQCLRKLGRDRLVLCDGPVLEHLAQEWDKQVGFSGGNDRQDALRNCLGKLKGEDRSRLGAYYGDRQTIRALADEEDRSEASLQQIFHRLRVKLKGCIEGQIAGEGEPV
ncbi:sigma-70 family RNA polymerase sigma factor [Verrucomicrobiales bacterium]|nr:sigma-70 family RNA polymerase sigma factor [Verrucomicrobiales bacterium]